MPRLTFTFLSILAAAAILVGSLVDIGSINEISHLLGEDKLLHLGAYFTLTATTYLAFTFDWKKTHVHATVFILCFTFGMILEFAQSFLTDFRQGDPYDLLANTLGIVIALFLGKTIKKIAIKSRIFLN